MSTAEFDWVAKKAVRCQLAARVLSAVDSEVADDCFVHPNKEVLRLAVRMADWAFAPAAASDAFVRVASVARCQLEVRASSPADSVGDYFVRLLEATAFPESSRAELGVGADCFLHLSVADIRQVVLCSAADQAFALPASSVVFHWGAKAARHR